MQTSTGRNHEVVTGTTGRIECVEAPETWLDLAGHGRLWQAAAGWWNDGRPDGVLVVEGSPGSGKSFWLRELHRRLRPSRTCLVHAEFGPGERPEMSAVNKKWSECLARHVEPGRNMACADWVELALKVMRADGYKVLLSIETDRTPDKFVTPYAHIYLHRKSFEGFGEQRALLLPWSNDELGEALEQRWPGLDWPGETVERVWLQAVGQPRLAMILANRLAGLAYATGIMEVEPGWVVETSRQDGFTEDWAGHLGLI